MRDSRGGLGSGGGGGSGRGAWQLLALLLGAAATAGSSACSGCSDDTEPIGATGDGAGGGAGLAGGSGGSTVGQPCGSCTCDPGSSCESGVCQDGSVAWIPYDLAEMRGDSSLDVHVTFTAPGGTPEALAATGVRLDCPSVQVAWRGEGTYSTDERDDDPWWATAPLALSRSRDYADVAAEGSSASLLTQTYQDMGWGLWQNAIGNASTAQQSRRQAFIDAGLPVLGYLEGTGNLFVFLAAIDDPPQTIGTTDVTATRYTHWSWGNWSGAFPATMDAIWMGPHVYYGAPAYAEPYTKNHSTYGDAVAVTDPDGNPVTSPPGADADPRLHGLYRQCGATDINGEPHLDLSLQAGRDVTGLEGVVTIGGNDYSIMGLARDPACPTWLRYHEVSLSYAVDQGTVGCWMDNVSLWDAFGLVPADAAFGAHANARFESFVTVHAPTGFLSRSGLEQHLGAMNARCIVKWKARTGFGDDVGSAGLCSDPIAMSHPGLMDPRWDADLAWGAYLAHTAQIHVDHYDGMQQVLDALDPDFLWGVNDLPNYGTPVGESIPPAMNLSELALGPHILFGGTRVPPEGSLAPMFDVAGAFDRSQFQTVWLYVDEPGLEESGELHRALSAEALAYDTFLMPSADDARAPGTTASAGALNAWLLPHAAELEGRRPWTAVGVVFSADSWLRAFRPGGVESITIPDPPGTRQVRNFSHQHDFAGWHLVLGKRNVQAQPLLAGRLEPGSLDELELVVLPDVQAISQHLRDGILRPWVEAGGVLVISGRTGRYRGRDAMLEPWATDGGSAPIGTEPLTGIVDLDGVSQITAVTVGSGTVVVVPGTPAADAWLGRGYGAIDTTIAWLETQDLLPQRVLSAPAGPEVLVRLHEDRWRGRLFVDLVSRAYDPSSDQLAAAGPQQVTVALPTWLHGLSLDVRTAASRGTATAEVAPEGDEMTIAVDAVADIVTVIVEAPVP
ncbi:MAG: hypothetical protein JRI23_05135 [Deltaproteobacteria bacterium]|jgi:hypothetical protein|nr:hypothetical protein [Deltaproteobacteria bacterium]MBW2530935.1 hypothetical protein [Deltaproteobacteria bacterium]